MLSEEKIVQKLSRAGYRITQPRRAVIRALLEDGKYSSPGEVHKRAARHHPTVGLVTVYRTLDLLSELGFARRIHTEDGCHGYAAANRGHRHHMVCRQCGATVEFEGCDLSPFLIRLSQETGYTIEDHLLELVGVCATCQKHGGEGLPETASAACPDQETFGNQGNQESISVRGASAIQKRVHIQREEACSL